MFPIDIRVEFPKKLREQVPLGSRFRADVKICQRTNKETGKPDKYYNEFLHYLDLTEDDFWEIVDSWRSPHIWSKDGNEWRLRHAVYDDRNK